MNYSNATATKLNNYLNANQDFKTYFLSLSYDEQKTAVKMIIALNKI